MGGQGAHRGVLSRLGMTLHRPLTSVGVDWALKRPGACFYQHGLPKRMTGVQVLKKRDRPKMVDVRVAARTKPKEPRRRLGAKICKRRAGA